MKNEYRVKMAEYKISKSPDVLKTVGLGSCVGVAIYDKYSKIGGLIHIMLPENKGSSRLAKYADTGIPYMVKEMVEYGGMRSNFVAKIAGGAQMFKTASETSSMKIGQRNIRAVKEVLLSENIDIIGEDVGKNYGRSISFFTEDGCLLVKSFKKGELTL